VTHSSSTKPKTDVAATVALLHRRRGWVWTAVLGFVAWFAALALPVALAPGGRGAGQAVADAFVLLLTVLTVVAVAAAVVDTVRLQRLERGARAHAAQRTAHHPVYAHPYRYPPRHRFTWLYGWAVMVLVLGIGIGALPVLVNAAGYLAGARRSVMFMPTSVHEYHSHGTTTIVTNGFLENPARTPATWPGQVPLGKPFPVRQPLWAWGWGSHLITSELTAVGSLLASLLFEGLSVLVLVAAAMAVRNVLRHQ
jgi:hypothetical protein